MRIFYKVGFYSDEVHEHIPEGAVEITPEYHMELLDGQSNGMQIMPDDNGYPILVYPQPSKYHEFKNGDWYISDENIQRLLDDQRSEIWTRIKQRKQDANNAGVYIKRVDKYFQTDEVSKAKYYHLDRTIDRVGSIDWKCQDNTYIEMNRELLDDILVQITLDENHNQKTAEQHRTNLYQAEDPLHYDYSTGWSDIPTNKTN